MHGNAKEQVEIAEEKEIVETSTIQAKCKNKHGDITQKELDQKLDSNAGNDKTEVIDNGDTLVVKFVDSGRYYEVDVDGNTEGPKELIKDEYAGDLSKGGKNDGSEEKPFEINCIEDLVAFSQNVNDGNQYGGNYIKLIRTLDFDSIFSYNDYKTTEYDEYLGGDGKTELKQQLSQKGNGFRPIGDNSKYFKGNFDGNDYEIKNIYENTTSYAGLFGSIYGATIKNISVSGNVITSAEYAGGIVGYSPNDANNKIINCYNYAKIESENYSGGIVGRTNYGNQSVYNCGNFGEITGKYTGGIISQVYGTTGTIKISNCYNIGNVNGTYAGGILGVALGGTATPSYLENCYNVGNIKGSVYGAILGNVNNVKKVKNCYYLDNVDKSGVSTNYEENVKCLTANYMISEGFLNELNTYVKEYNNSNSTDSEFIMLNEWILDKSKEYPILKF